MTRSQRYASSEQIDFWWFTPPFPASIYGQWFNKSYIDNNFEEFIDLIMNSLSNFRRFGVSSYQYLVLFCLTLHFVVGLSAQTIRPDQTDQIIIDAGKMDEADPGDRIRYTGTITETGWTNVAKLTPVGFEN